MKVTFGITLDGFDQATVPCVLDAITCGQRSMLDLLETRLGLKIRHVSRAQRILQFRNLLEAVAASRETFYRRSFENDPLATATTLLQWRDNLIEAGWDGVASGSDSQRLQDLAAVEAHTAGKLGPGTGDRLAAILKELDSRQTQIESLTVLDPPEHLPTVWKRLCDKLGARYQSIDSVFRTALFDTSTDLGAIQTLLMKPNNGAARKLILHNDGSLLCLTAHSEVTLAQAIAQWLRALRRDSRTTLVTRHDAGILDRALAALDEPTLGLQPRSVVRPIPQVLLLALRLRWQPLDPRALLEFLTHPVCPVTRRLRHRLAKAVATSPGIGGPNWNAAVEAVRESTRQETDASAQGEALQRIEQDLARWLLCERFDEKADAPGAILSECCAQVARWAGARASAMDLDAHEADQFKALASLAAEVGDLLRSLPSVTRVHLEHLLREAASLGWTAAGSPAELGHVHWVSTPGAFTEPADNVVWWDFSEPAATPRLPWTAVELQQLALHGARLPAPEMVAAQTTAFWLRPLMAARKKMILAMPRQRGGEPVARHPLHTRLLALIDASSPALPTIDLDHALAVEKDVHPVRFVTLDHRPLPRLQRWWKLPSAIAILSRTNADAAQIAAALSGRGLPVSLAQSGLLATPEVRLAIACLRRLADPKDTLATAEIIALQGSLTPESWLAQRLEYLDRRAGTTEAAGVDRWGVDEPFAYPAIQALEQARSTLTSLSVREALHLALDAATVFATVSSWGPGVARAAQRRANLESLGGLAQKYEEACVRNHLPATVAGFLVWCDDLAGSGGDAKGLDDQLNAIHVSTYHKAKGLEWPVVACTGFDDEPRSRMWGLTIAKEDPSKPFDTMQPLLNRRLRFWVWPFGAQKAGIPLVRRLSASPTGREAERVAEQEELRLLYVGFTRARDLLVVAKDIGKSTPWLELLDARWFRPSGGRLRLPNGGELSAIEVTLKPPQQAAAPTPDPVYCWFPPPVPRTAKEYARLIPSQQPAVTTFSVGRMIDLGARLPLTGNPDEAALGDALHAVLAAELAHLGHPTRRTTAEGILRAYGLDTFIRVEDVIVMVDRFLTHLRNEFSPKSILVETPFEYANEKGQRLAGFIDLLLETDRGWVVIDHKSFMGKRSDWNSKALSYGGQIAVYRNALLAGGRTFASAWIHFAAGGGLVQIN